MNLFKTTKHYSNWWSARKADWKTSYLDTYDHPHRKLIVNVLRDLPWLSLLEIGCNAGPNLVAIIKAMPGRQVGGIDVNPEAIELAEKTLHNGFFSVGSADNMMMSDKSVDVILSDMTLIYVDRLSIDKYVKEMTRVARNYVVLCEFHSKSWWNRFALRFNMGYKAYDWPKLLEKHGYYDVLTYKLKPEDWDGHEPQKTFAHIVLAKVPQI